MALRYSSLQEDSVAAADESLTGKVWSPGDNPYSYLDEIRPPNPANIAAVTARAHRSQKLRRDAEALFRAAQISRRHECHSLSNALMKLAQALSTEADNCNKRTDTVEVRKEVVNGREQPLV